ncbi:MAG: hypothetical protein JKY99_08275 [Rhizobiales bacterium]|nr:hypothetical protein [Hyphomicrobiales bacterium]
MLPERNIVDRYLTKIFLSRDFATSKRLQRLLRYIVDAMMSGNEELIKGYTIALDVFDRPTSFDPNLDSIVRVQAGRLRKALKNYYNNAGSSDLLRFSLPKGGYRIMFEDIEVPADPDWELDDLENAPKPRAAETGQKISVGVLPFTFLSQSRDTAALADGLADEIISLLARNEAMSVASRHASFRFREPTDLRQIGAQLGARYLVDGGIRRAGDHVRINVYLVDSVTGINIWNHRFDCDLEGPFALPDKLAIKIVMSLRMQLYLAAKRDIQHKNNGERTSWEVFLQSTWMPDETTFSLEHEKAHIAQAQSLLDRDPKSGKAHSILADKLSYLCNLDPLFDTADNRKAAKHHARLALDLEPRNSDVTFNVSMHYWHTGDIFRSVSAAKRTLELEPHHLIEAFLIKAIPYSCTAVPDAVLEGLIAADSDLPQDIMERWVTLSWIGLMYLNNGSYQEAADFGWRGRAVFSARSPETTIWLCCALVQLGDVEAAQELIENVLEYWPTLSLHHYADVVVPRHYVGCGLLARIQSDFRALARVVKTHSDYNSPKPKFMMIRGGKD